MSSQCHKLHPIIIKLLNLINTTPDWYSRFQEALISVLKYNLDEFSNIHNLNDWLSWCNDLLFWIPVETPDGNNVDHKLINFYFFLNQPSLLSLQNEPILSKWMDDYAKAIGEFLDTTESLTEESLKTFYNSPIYRLNEYMSCPSGWKTFNQFFARHVKPGYRPIDGLCNNHILASVADSVFKGSLPIDSNTEIDIKGIKWSINELLYNYPDSDYFKNGTFMHAYLSPMDYHRLHVPLSGKVLYTDIVPGNVYLETHVVEKKLVTRRSKYIIDSEDRVGFQFTQARGILILETLAGIIAILPIGMSLVSSVVITAETGSYLHKGQEFAYFQFGGSDYIMLFPYFMSISFTANIGVHYNQGREIAVIDL